MNAVSNKCVGVCENTNTYLKKPKRSINNPAQNKQSLGCLFVAFTGICCDRVGHAKRVSLCLFGGVFLRVQDNRVMLIN